jgi:hypothetical protein
LLTTCIAPSETVSDRVSERVGGRVGERVGERVDDRVTSPELDQNFNSLQYGRGRTLTKN